MPASIAARSVSVIGRVRSAPITSPRIPDGFDEWISHRRLRAFSEAYRCPNCTDWALADKSTLWKFPTCPAAPDLLGTGITRRRDKPKSRAVFLVIIELDRTMKRTALALPAFARTIGPRRPDNLYVQGRSQAEWQGAPHGGKETDGRKCGVVGDYFPTQDTERFTACMRGLAGRLAISSLRRRRMKTCPIPQTSTTVHFDDQRRRRMAAGVATASAAELSAAPAMARADFSLGRSSVAWTAAAGATLPQRSQVVRRRLLEHVY